jgi:virginiamycin B lyase
VLTPLRWRLRPAYRPVAVVVLVAALVLAASPAAAATTVNIYQAKVASGKATVNAFSTGTGNLVLSVTGLKRYTTYAVAIHSGGCSSVGSKIVSLASTKSTSAGAIKKTYALTSGQASAVRNAMNTKGAAVRLGTGSITKCGALASIPVKITSIAIGDVGRAIASDASGVWATGYSTDDVTRIDPVSNKVSATVTAGTCPAGVAVGEGGVWVANTCSNNVTRIDPATNAVVTTIPVGLGPWDITTGGGAVWVVNSDGSSVTRIDPASNQVVATIPVGQYPYDVAFADGVVWVTTLYDGTLQKIDPATNTVVGTLFLGDVDSIAVGGGAVWVSVWGWPVRTDGWVAKIDPATGSVIASIKVGYDPCGMVFAGGALWVTMSGDPSIAKVVGSSVAGRYNLGMKSTDITTTPGALWVAHPHGSAVPNSNLFAGAVTRVNY